jgi:hypothetical protein
MHGRQDLVVRSAAAAAYPSAENVEALLKDFSKYRHFTVAQQTQFLKFINIANKNQEPADRLLEMYDELHDPESEAELKFYLSMTATWNTFKMPELLELNDTYQEQFGGRAKPGQYFKWMLTGKYHEWWRGFGPALEDFWNVETYNVSHVMDFSAPPTDEVSSTAAASNRTAGQTSSNMAKHADDTASMRVIVWHYTSESDEGSSRLEWSSKGGDKVVWDYGSKCGYCVSYDANSKHFGHGIRHQSFNESTIGTRSVWCIDCAPKNDSMPTINEKTVAQALMLLKQFGPGR